MKKLILALALTSFAAGFAMAQDAPVNLALAANGAVVTTDSVFPGYMNTTLTDGVDNSNTKLNWVKAGWASVDKPVEHWAEVAFAKATSLSKVTLFWCFDKGSYHSSVTYSVQYWDGAAWVSLKDETAGTQNVASSEILAPAGITAAKIRFYQPIGGGPANRPNIAWVAEITAAP